MTIITRKGNLLDAKGIIVHGCNCQGVMGSGVAYVIRKKWPKVYEEYRLRYDAFGLRLGEAQFVPVGDGVMVVNAMTQEFFGHGKRFVSEEAVHNAFKTVASFALACGAEVVNFPLIGCGLGGGSWDTIGPIIDEALGPDLEKVLWIL